MSMSRTRPSRAVILRSRDSFGEVRRIRVPDRHGPVVPHDAVGVVLGTTTFVGRHFPMQIERARLDAEMHAVRARREQVIEGRRQDVLPGMLLAEILPPHAVDRPADGVPGAIASLT